MSVSVPDLSLDFLPLFPEMTEEKLLADWQDWANEGLDPVADADIWADTREGAHWFMVTMPMIRECSRIYDLMGTEVPMSAFVLWAWETYLDDLAAVYDIERNPATPALGTETFFNSGLADEDITVGTTISANPSTPDDPAPLFEVTTGGTVPAGGSIDLPIQAVELGSSGDVGANAITAQSTPLPAGITFTNSEPTTGGSDVESDDRLRQRILDAIAGKGPGAAADYVRWAGAWPGVGRVTVVPVWNGASTVLVMVSDPNGLPLPDAIVTALQTDLDPVAGQGAGTAPVGAHVTVETSSLLNIDFAATIEYEPGYSWDGFGGTTAVGDGIQAALTRYLLACPPGGEVVYEHAKGTVATWQGVHDVTAFTMNGAGVNIAVPLGPPPKVPVVHTFVAS